MNPGYRIRGLGVRFIDIFKMMWFLVSNPFNAIMDNIIMFQSETF